MKMKLADISKKISKGSTPRGKVNYSKNENNYFLRVTDMVDLANVYNSEFTLSDEDINKNKMKMWPINTILVSIEGTVGKISILKKEMSFNQAVAGIIPNEEIINPRYLMYYLRTTPVFSGILKGTIMPALRLGDLSEIEIEVPDMEIQNKMVSIVDSITNKIDLNNKTNNNLFELLKQEFRDKFYNKEEKDLYLIDYISETIGGDWGKENPEGNNNTKVYCVRGADIPSMEYGNKGNAPIRYILEKNYKNKKLAPNNIIIEISGGSPTQSTGRTAYITKNILDMYDSPLLCTNFCRAIETKSDILAPFVYMNLKLKYEDDIFFNWENGTTGIKNLALNDMLSNLEVKSPDEIQLKDYYLLFNNAMNKISSNSNENIKLEQLRDTLLPKLMNGEIDLDNIEI